MRDEPRRRATPLSRLVLVRHAQASFPSDPSQAFVDYDRLSELGERHAEVLGEELADSGAIFDRVLVGPATRHAQTLELVGHAYGRRGLPWPDPVALPSLKEHQGSRIVRRALDRPAYDHELEDLVARYATADPGEDKVRLYFSAFRHVTRQWALRELPVDIADGESWQAFRKRVTEGIGDVLRESGSGDHILAFTSGGPIGSTVAWVLGLSDVEALEFAWSVQNATLTEFLFSGERTSLKSFNVHARLGSPELVTYV